MRMISLAVLAVALGACAAAPVPDAQQAAPASPPLRDLKPVTTVRPQDSTTSCAELEQEIQANNLQVTQLAKENGWRLTQNNNAGGNGVFVWPVWFAMDFKGASNIAAASLQARQQHLATIVGQRCAEAAPPSTQPPSR
jgi:hypothetical protein